MIADFRLAILDLPDVLKFKSAIANLKSSMAFEVVERFFAIIALIQCFAGR